ncbi:MAG: hypothetical protein SGBAC_007727 [Bacillariaceae sp.]
MAEALRTNDVKAILILDFLGPIPVSKRQLHAKCRAYSNDALLHMASSHGNIPLVRLLLCLGANVSTPNLDQHTPLWDMFVLAYRSILQTSEMVAACGPFIKTALVLCFLSLFEHCKGQETRAESSFLWVSDVHLEPDYGTPQAATKHNKACTLESSKETYPYGQFGCDAPTLLVEQTLDHAQMVVAEQGGVDFIVASGDFCRHGNELLDNPLQSTQDIIETVIGMITSRFPGVPIIVTVGNNDFTPDYYIDVEQTTENNTMLELVTTALNDTFLSIEEVSSFRNGAYYSRNISDTLTIISINTIIYSIDHSPDQQNIEDPFGQFVWFKDQLELAKSTGRRVWIVGHVAPTIGSYAHDNLWHPPYMDRYYDIIKDYFPDIICGQLFGHLHTDEFRLAHDYDSSSDFVDFKQQQKYPLYIASSFTSIYGSNPSFRLVTYEVDRGNLLDYDTYYFDSSIPTIPPDWIKAPSFRESFNIPDMSGDSVHSIIDRLAAEPSDATETAESLWDTFLSRQSIYAPPEMGPCLDRICRKEWVCTLSSISEDQYEECVVQTWSQGRHSESAPLAIVAAFMAVAIVLLGCIWKTRRCLVARQSYVMQYDDDEHLQDEDDNYENHRQSMEDQNSGEPASTDFIDDVPEIT